MKSKAELRALVRENLDSVISQVNRALEGKDLGNIKPVLTRIGRGGTAPHWFATLESGGTLPNLDGKTIGSVIEMLLVGVLETGLLAGEKITLRINPARGVDLPDLDLGVKSPSENYCTSEPFFSAYERLLGSEYDVLALITDYQQKKKTPPLKLQISKWAYLEGSELADKNLCAIAVKHRDSLIKENEARAQKLMKFLAYVNQSDWLAKQLVKAVSLIGQKQDASRQIGEFIKRAERDFARQNSKRIKKGRLPITNEDLGVIRSLANVSPLDIGILEAADNWVVTTFHEAGRSPNTNEWNKLKSSKLNGKIGVSAALQWRYNFGSVFNGDSMLEEEC